MNPGRDVRLNIAAMARIVLHRAREIAGQPTLGSILWDNGAVMIHSFVRTIELPWFNNAKGRSCIPEGTYRMRYSMSKRFSIMLWEVLDVPDRTGIRFHAGNYAGVKVSDSDGCILPCEMWEDLNDDGVIDGKGSKVAMTRLRELLRPYEQTGIELVIRRAK